MKRLKTEVILDDVTGITSGNIPDAELAKDWELVVKTTGGSVDGVLTVTADIGTLTSNIILMQKTFKEANTYGPFVILGRYSKITASLVSTAGTFRVEATGDQVS